MDMETLEEYYKCSNGMITKIEQMKSFMESEKDNSNHVFKSIYKVMENIEKEHKNNPELFTDKTGIKTGFKIQHLISILYEVCRFNTIYPWDSMFHSIGGSLRCELDILVNPRFRGDQFQPSYHY